MCGITGIISFQSSIDPQNIHNMNETLLHRGQITATYGLMNVVLFFLVIQDYPY